MQKLFIPILILAAFLRFFNLPEIAIFTFDEEHQITIAKTLVDNFHIIWIGVSASNLGFYLGPFWHYFTAFWLLISGGDPLITNYIGATIGLITIYIIFFVTTKLFSVKAGLIAATLYATLPLFVLFDQKYLTPNPVPVLSLLLMYSAFKSFKNIKWFLLFTICFGLVFHTSLSIFAYIFLGIFVFIQKKIWKEGILTFTCILLFISIISPLIIFDFLHDFSNITTPLRISEITANSPHGNISTRFSYLSETFGRIWYLKPGLSNADEIPFACETIFKDQFPNYDFKSIRTKPFWLLSAVTCFLIALFLFRKTTWKNLNSRILGMSLVALLGSFLFFHGGPFEYYLLGALPLVLIIIGVFVSNLPKKLFYLSLVVLAVFISLGIYTTLNVNQLYGLKVKKELITEVMGTIKNEPFELQNNGVCHKYDGWRYLFTVYGRVPERSDTDQSLGWLYPHEITQTPAKYKVIMSEAKILPIEDITQAKVIEKGGFRAYIISLK